MSNIHRILRALREQKDATTVYTMKGSLAVFKSGHDHRNIVIEHYGPYGALKGQHRMSRKEAKKVAEGLTKILEGG